MPIFNSDLETALSTLLGENPRQRGHLGYKIAGQYRVQTVGNANKFYVRMDVGGVVQAFHRSRVAPQPDLPVYVQLSRRGDLEIIDVDWTRALQQFGSAASIMGVGPHTHARFSGMEFPIDPRLLAPLQAQLLGGLNVGFSSGFYWTSAEYLWWPGTVVLDLTAALPGDGLHSHWTIVYLDTTADPPVLAYAVGSDHVAAASLTLTELAGLMTTSVPTLAIPILGVRMTGGQTYLVEASLEALPTFYRPGASAAEPDGDIIAVISRILTDDDGNVLTDDDGNVLVGDP